MCDGSWGANMNRLALIWLDTWPLERKSPSKPLIVIPSNAMGEQREREGGGEGNETNGLLSNRNKSGGEPRPEAAESASTVRRWWRWGNSAAAGSHKLLCLSANFVPFHTWEYMDLLIVLNPQICNFRTRIWIYETNAPWSVSPIIYWWKETVTCAVHNDPNLCTMHGLWTELVTAFPFQQGSTKRLGNVRNSKRERESWQFTYNDELGHDIVFGLVPFSLKSEGPLQQR